jgi:isoaspartyl peptidase/L-asparaginase-like protein (Ntn-hydrolase superfamily)
MEVLKSGRPALDAIELGANVVELDPTVMSVGYGGLPNADGIVELDAAIMDGRNHGAGSVAAVKTVRTPISLARRVMETTRHTMLAGENADAFARKQGFPVEDLLTAESRQAYSEWKAKQTEAEVAHFKTVAARGAVEDNHDTIGLCALDGAGNLAAGCTTSGFAWKVPGRVGDSPIIGAGLYVDGAIGAVAATGHGDEMMKALLSYRAVTAMGRGLSPTEACSEALRYLMSKIPPASNGDYGAALIALRKDGDYGAAATESGFGPPDRVWTWVVATVDGVTTHQGPYIPAP